MNRVRARTSSTDPALRLLFVGVAFLLLNLWVVLKRQLACDVHRRGKRQNHHGLTVLRLCHFLIRAIERRLRTVDAIRKLRTGSPLVLSAGNGGVG